MMMNINDFQIGNKYLLMGIKINENAFLPQDENPNVELYGSEDFICARKCKLKRISTVIKSFS